MYKISIIVPVYNAENYIDIALQSICGQTYPHLEIILVNDVGKRKQDNIPHLPSRFPSWYFL